jgi:malonate transporter and related proteins
VEGVATGFAVIGAVIAIGFALGRSGALGAEGHLVLNTASFFAATPALLFSVMARSDLNQIFSPHMAVAAMAFAAAALTYLLLNRLLFADGPGSTIVGMAASGFANNNNIGLPLTLFVLGDVHYAAIVLLMQTVLVTPGLLMSLAVVAGSERWWRIIPRALLGNPVILAAAAGLGVSASGIQLPPVISAPIELLAGAAIPVVLLAFGASFARARPLRRGSGLKRVALASSLKLLLMPVVAGVLARFVFGLDGIALFAAIVVAALPTGQMVFSYAARYGVGTTLARDTVLVTTLGSVPVVTAIALFFSA